MKLAGAVVVVTGGATGIGAGLCRRFAQEGARVVVVADRDAAGAARVAEEIGGHAVALDVARSDDTARVIDELWRKYDGIDLFCSNAGIISYGGPEAPDADWQRIWDINVMGHVFAARALVPLMMARGSGYLLNTASAAGLLSQIGSAPYAVTKHAAVAFAEWLSITYGDKGVKVSCLCPQGVRTNMLVGERGDRDSFLLAGSVSVEEVAEAVVAGLDAEEFLILPHAEVRDFFQRKATDYERWIRGMRRLRDKVREQFGL